MSTLWGIAFSVICLVLLLVCALLVNSFIHDNKNTNLHRLRRDITRKEAHREKNNNILSYGIRISIALVCAVGCGYMAYHCFF